MRLLDVQPHLLCGVERGEHPFLHAGDGAPGLGIGGWLKVDQAPALHDELAGSAVSIVTEPFDGPFGCTFAFRDLDGHVITAHDGA